MLPAEYTTIAGWDFDIDKLYMMLPSFSISNQYNMKEAMLAFYKDNKDVFEAIEQSKKLNFQRARVVPCLRLLCPSDSKSGLVCRACGEAVLSARMLYCSQNCSIRCGTERSSGSSQSTIAT